MAREKHIHKYVKYRGRPGYWRCDDSNCLHFIDRERIVGKYSKCTECSTPFILTYESLKKARPKCLNCSGTKRAMKIREATARLLERLEAQNLIPVPTEPDVDAPYNDEEDRF